ncbi:hypothetical protein M3Y98_00074000 [Aphelenchoides besseyi]|nr:hypothetical protein M3Y98_00074000 [Aphelenchoides besseyi]
MRFELFLLFVFLSSAAAIRCWKCLDDTSCTHKQIQNCKDQDLSCKKEIYPNGTIQKDCYEAAGDKDDILGCHQELPYGKIKCICNHELCNAASGRHLQLMIFLLPLIFIR